MNKTERLLLALTEDEMKRLEDAAKFEGVTKQEIVRRVIAKIPVLGVIVNETVKWYEEPK